MRWRARRASKGPLGRRAHQRTRSCLPTRAGSMPSDPDSLHEPSTMGASIEASSVPPRSGAVALGEHLPSLPRGNDVLRDGCEQRLQSLNRVRLIPSRISNSPEHHKAESTFEQRLNRHGKVRNDSFHLWDTLGSVMSTIMKRAMRASSETVSVMSRVAGTSKSSRMGR